MTSDPATEAKRALRARMLERRAAITAAERRAAASALARHGLSFLQPKPDAVIAGYAAIRHEIDPAMLLRELAAAGHEVALPVVRERDQPLEFRQWRPGHPLEPGVLRVPVPRAGARVLEPDILLVPLVAFDRAGYRLGFGAGFYDRTLAALRMRHPVVAVGVAFAAQEAHAVPHGPHDQRIDWVLTPSGPVPARPPD